jgi:hypothetical protein
MIDSPSRDRPTTKDEIEVTKEMIEAGVDAYLGYYSDLNAVLIDPLPIRRMMVEKVFRAMITRMLS